MKLVQQPIPFDTYSSTWAKHLPKQPPKPNCESEMQQQLPMDECRDPFPCNSITE